MGFIFAFHVLPTIIFFGALMSVLYHLGVVQKIVRSIAYVMTKTMKTSGAESLSIAGNIFVGQTEAPLLIKPYVGKMTVSELSAVMEQMAVTPFREVTSSCLKVLLQTMSIWQFR